MSKMIFFLIILLHTQHNLQFAFGLFASHDCKFRPEFEPTACSWKLDPRVHRTDQGLMISSDDEKYFRNKDDFLTLFTSSRIEPKLIENPESCSVEISVHTTGFDGYALNWLLKKHHRADKTTNLDLHRINPGIFEKGTLKQTRIGRPKNPFEIELELVPFNRKKSKYKWELYISGVRFLGCVRNGDDCILSCDEKKCIGRDAICDVTTQCSDGKDEQQNCSELPNGAYLSYSHGELDEYNWTNYGDNIKWLVKNGSVSSKFTSVSKEEAIMQSPIFSSINPEHRQRSSPNFGACKLRFYHWIEFGHGRLTVSALEFENEQTNKNLNSDLHHTIDRFKIKETHELFSQLQSKPDTHWTFTAIPLPQTLLGPYRLKFVGSNPLGFPISKTNSIRIANLSLSKECFSNDSFEDPPDSEYIELLQLPKFGAKIKGIKINSCGQSGHIGPNTDQCLSFYGENSSVQIIGQGIQSWKAPRSAFYTLFLAGAQGGHGYHASGGKGAFMRAVVYLKENERLIILVGQSGESSCFQSPQSDKVCDHKNTFLGSGGGGASYVFSVGVDDKNDQLNTIQARDLLFKLSEHHLIAIAAGGGGSGSSRNTEKSNGEKGLFFNKLLPESESDQKRLKINWQDRTLKLLRNETNPSNFSDCKGQTQRSGGWPAGSKGCKHGGSGDGYMSSMISSNDTGGVGGTSYFNDGRVHLVAFSSAPVNNVDYEFANGGKMNHDLKSKLDENTSLYNGFVVIYEQIDSCCQDTYPCVVVNSDPLENADVLCVCSFTSFQSKNCTSIVVRISLILAVLVLIVILVISGHLLQHIPIDGSLCDSNSTSYLLYTTGTCFKYFKLNGTQIERESLRKVTNLSDCESSTEKQLYRTFDYYFDELGRLKLIVFERRSGRLFGGVLNLTSSTFQETNSYSVYDTNITFTVDRANRLAYVSNREAGRIESVDLLTGRRANLSAVCNAPPDHIRLSNEKLVWIERFAHRTCFAEWSIVQRKQKQLGCVGERVQSFELTSSKIYYVTRDGSLWAIDRAMASTMHTPTATLTPKLIYKPIQIKRKYQIQIYRFALMFTPTGVDLYLSDLVHQGLLLASNASNESNGKQQMPKVVFTDQPSLFDFKFINRSAGCDAIENESQAYDGQSNLIVVKTPHTERSLERSNANTTKIHSQQLTDVTGPATPTGSELECTILTCYSLLTYIVVFTVVLVIVILSALLVLLGQKRYSTLITVDNACSIKGKLDNIRFNIKKTVQTM